MSRSSNNNDDELIKAVAFCFITGVGLIATGVKRMRVMRLVQDTGSIPVGSAPQGLVELQGFAWPMKVQESPLEHRACVYYSVEVQERRKSGKNSRWVTIHTESTNEAFFLADESGHAIIYPERAELELRKKEVEWSALDHSARDRISAMLTMRGVVLGSGRYRVIESAIAVGAPFYALGTFRTTAASQAGEMLPLAGLRHFLQKAHLLRRNQSEAKKILDLDCDGRISFEEWYQGYAKEALVAGGNFRNEPVVLPKGMKHVSECFGVMRSANGNQLYLADCHQEELLQRLNSWNFVRVVGGALLIALGAVLLFCRFAK
jgi:hypothetical protein